MQYWIISTNLGGLLLGESELEFPSDLVIHLGDIAWLRLASSRSHRRFFNWRIFKLIEFHSPPNLLLLCYWRILGSLSHVTGSIEGISCSGQINSLSPLLVAMIQSFYLGFFGDSLQILDGRFIVKGCLRGCGRGERGGGAERGWGIRWMNSIGRVVSFSAVQQDEFCLFPSFVKQFGRLILRCLGVKNQGLMAGEGKQMDGVFLLYGR